MPKILIVVLDAARQCLAKAEHLKREIGKLHGYTLPLSAPTFHEIVVGVRGGDAANACAALLAQDIIAGLDLGRIDPRRRGELLIAVTERHTRRDLDRLIGALASYAP